MSKKSPAPPPAPDYAGAAQQQGVANLEAARLTARLSNPNIRTPLGGQRVSWGRANFDQNAYNAAMADYNRRNPQQQSATLPQGGKPNAQPPGGAPSSYGKPNAIPPTVGVGDGAMMPTTNNRLELGPQMKSGGQAIGGMGETEDRAYTMGGPAQQRAAQMGGGMMIGDMMYRGPGATGGGPMGGGFSGNRMDSSGMGPGQMQRAMQGYNPSFSQYGYTGNAAPTREMFTQMTDLDTPFIEQYLTPEAQATLEAQQRVERSLAGLGEGAINRVQNLYSTDFSPTGLPAQQFSFDRGAMPTLGPLEGRASGDYNALPVNFGPTGGQFGTAGAGPQGLNLGGFDASRVGGIAAAPTGGQFGAATGGPAAGQFGQAQGGPGGVNFQGLDTSGITGVQTGAGPMGQATGGPNAPTLQGQLDTQNLAQMPVNAGMTAQQAIMSRLDPSLQRQRSQLETQLANQGLVRGGEAYDVALQEQGQRENDLRTQAALQGLQLDMQARQQGLGEAQALGGFANQAALSGFGAGQQATQAQNAAVAQNAQQALQSGQFANQAQAQQFAQRLASGEFGREAQMASFQTGQAAQDAVNRAISQNFGQAQAAGQMGNQAIGQNFQQALASQQAALQAQQQGFGQQMSGQQFGRESALQGFQSQQAAQEAANRAISQNFQQALQGQGAYNAAAAQQFGQGMDVQSARNAAIMANQQSQLQQAQAMAALQAQGFNQSQAAAAFQNAQRQAAMQEQLALRNQPLNEITALMGASQVQMPQFQAYQGADVAAAPIFGATQAAGNFAQQNYGNQVAANNAKLGMYGSLFDAAGTAAGGGFFGNPFGT
jgi:hypothetical protein